LAEEAAVPEGVAVDAVVEVPPSVGGDEPVAACGWVAGIDADGPAPCDGQAAEPIAISPAKTSPTLCARAVMTRP
jgi:hypothetical protein